jgi:hypothetical protein
MTQPVSQLVGHGSKGWSRAGFQHELRRRPAHHAVAIPLAPSTVSGKGSGVGGDPCEHASFTVSSQRLRHEWVVLEELWNRSMGQLARG